MTTAIPSGQACWLHPAPPHQLWAPLLFCPVATRASAGKANCATHLLVTLGRLFCVLGRRSNISKLLSSHFALQLRLLPGSASSLLQAAPRVFLQFPGSAVFLLASHPPQSRMRRGERVRGILQGSTWQALLTGRRHTSRKVPPGLGGLAGGEFGFVHTEPLRGLDTLTCGAFVHSRDSGEDAAEGCMPMRAQLGGVTGPWLGGGRGCGRGGGGSRWLWR